MTENDYNRLLAKRYIADEASGDEVEVFFHLLKEGKIDNELLEAVNENEGLIQPAPIAKVARWWPRLAAAAALLLVLSTGVFYLLHKPADKVKTTGTDNSYKNDVLPGGNKAALTLADGSVIILDSARNGRLTDQGSATILKVNDGQLAYDAVPKEDEPVAYNTLATPKGGQYKITLADGSKVWLNSVSSLRYPTSFAGSERMVELTGEGYFEIAKDAARPFRVSVADRGVVEVLGTHFNINSYADEPSANTTLLEGSISISPAKGPPVILTPGQQAQLTNEDEIKVINDPDIEDVTAWKNELFYLNKNIQSIMREVQRWYDVEVVYTEPPAPQIFVGKISRNEPVSKLLRILEYTGGVHFSIEGKTITVKP